MILSNGDDESLQLFIISYQEIFVLYIKVFG